MTQLSIFTNKRQARPSPRYWPSLSTKLTSFPRHAYFSSYCKNYEPLGAITERCPLSLIHKTTTFSDASRAPDTVLLVNLYPTLTKYRCSQDVSIDLYGTSVILRRFAYLPADTEDDVPSPSQHGLRPRWFPNVMAVKIEALEQERRLVKLEEQKMRDAWQEQWGETFEDSCTRREIWMAEEEQRKREERDARARKELGQATESGTEDDDVDGEEEEQQMAKSDKQKKGGKKKQRARIEDRLRKAKEKRVEAKFEDRKRRELRPSPPPRQTASESDGHVDEDYDNVDEQAQSSSASNAPSTQVESSTREEMEVAKQKPVINLPPPVEYNAGERASLSRDPNIQEEDAAPKPVVRLPPAVGHREEQAAEGSSSIVNNPAFAVSKEEYSEGAGQEVVVVRVPRYEPPSPSSTKNKNGWDKVLSRKEKRKVKEERAPSPVRSETHEAQPKEPRPRFPGTRRRSPVQTSGSVEQEAVSSQTTAGNVEQLDITGIQEMMQLQRKILDEEIRQMKEDYEAQYPALHYDAASHTAHGNRRASDPGPPAAHFGQTATADPGSVSNPHASPKTPSDLKPAPLGINSGLRKPQKKKKKWYKRPADNKHTSPNQKFKVPASPERQRKSPTRPSKVPINRHKNPPPQSKQDPRDARRLVIHHHHRTIHHHHHHRPPPLQLAPRSTLSPTALPYSPSPSLSHAHEMPQQQQQQQYESTVPSYVAPPQPLEQLFYWPYPQHQMYPMPPLTPAELQSHCGSRSPSAQWSPAHYGSAYVPQGAGNPSYPHHWQ